MTEVKLLLTGLKKQSFLFTPPFPVTRLAITPAMIKPTMVDLELVSVATHARNTMKHWSRVPFSSDQLSAPKYPKAPFKPLV